MWHLIYALCYNGTLTNIDFIVNKYVRWQITKNVHMLLMRMHVRVRRTLCAVVGEYSERAIAESSYRWLPSEPVPAMIRLSYVLLVIVTQVLRYYQLLYKLQMTNFTACFLSSMNSRMEFKKKCFIRQQCRILIAEKSLL